LICSFCKAKANQDCATSSGGWAAVHLVRINAAALIDRTRKQMAKKKAKKPAKKPTKRNQTDPLPKKGAVGSA